MVLPAETADDFVDRADRLMYASKNGGRNRVTGDSGELVSIAERPLLGIAFPWEMSGVVDLDGFGRGAQALAV